MNRSIKHFNSSSKDTRVKGKNSRKPDEKMAARVKSVIDKDTRVTILEIAETLGMHQGIFQIL